MAVPRRTGGRPTTSSPPIRMTPAVGSSWPAIMRRIVVLPQPDGPSRQQ
jgi:hypothetical protein